MTNNLNKLTLALFFSVSISGCSLLKQEFSQTEKPIDDNSLLVESFPPATEGPPLETTELTVPDDWITYTEPAYNYSISHPETFKITPAPTEGGSGLTRYSGENNGESIWIELGEHVGISKTEPQSLREVEITRSPETEFESERVFDVNGLRVYQQLIGLRSGSGQNSKTHGIYNIFEMNGKLYFFELYTSNPFDHFELVSQMLGSIESVE